jgi:TonB family protein
MFSQYFPIFQSIYNSDTLIRYWLMKYTFATLFLCCFSFTSSAQSDTLIRFFDYLYREVPEKGSVYSALTIIQKMDDGNNMVQDFYLKTGKIMRRSYFTDSNLQNRIGPYEVFYENGKRKIKGIFNKNTPNGVWREWDDEGHLTDSVFYNMDGHMTGTRIQWHSNGNVSDSTVYAQDGSGRGESYEWYSPGQLRGKGEKINDRKNGMWIFYQRSGKPASEETYIIDSLISIRCFDEKGKTMSMDCVAEMDADFPGGIKAWQQYIAKRVYSNADELIKKGANGTAIVLFIIDTTGKVIDARLETKTNSYLDEFALRTINNSPRWIPARQHNITVKAYRKQPITYQEEE